MSPRLAIRIRPQNLVIHALLLLGVVPMVYPFIHMIMTSLMTPGEAMQVPPAFFPSIPQVGNYLKAFQQVPFARFLFNTAYITAITVAVQLILCSMAAYAVARLKFRGRELMFGLFLSVLMIPMHVRLIPNFLLISKLGWQDNHLALIVPGLFSAFGIFMLRQGFMQLPQALFDAAMIDGCTPWQSYWKVAMPLVKPLLAAFTINQALWKWNEFFWPLIMMRTPAKYVLSVGIYFFQDQYGTGDWPTMMAAATMAQLPLLLAFVLAQRTFMEALTSSGLKL